MPLRRRLAALLILSLPALLLAGWFVYERWPDWSSPLPAWARSGRPGTCEAAAALTLYKARAADGVPTAITRAEARKLAHDLVERHHGLPAAASDGPYLVRGDFPPHGEQTAWVQLIELDSGGADLGKIVLVFLRGDSGDPLVVLTSTSVSDAQSTCGAAPLGRRALLRQYAPLLGLALYAVLVGAAYFLFRVRRRLILRSSPV